MILEFVDVLVSGRFGEEQKIYGNWDFQREIEVDISENGELTLTGYPKDKFIKDLK
jgi:hypothetical protein